MTVIFSILSPPAEPSVLSGAEGLEARSGTFMRDIKASSFERGVEALE